MRSTVRSESFGVEELYVSSGVLRLSKEIVRRIDKSVSHPVLGVIATRSRRSARSKIQGECTSRSSPVMPVSVFAATRNPASVRS